MLVVHASRVGPRRPVRAAVAALLVATACGGGGPEPDIEAFCAIGPRLVPIEQATTEDLRSARQVASERVGDDLDVLVDAATRLERYDTDDPARLQVEFEVRFDPEFAAARDRVEAEVARCARIDDAPGRDPSDGPEPSKPNPIDPPQEGTP